MKTVINNLGNLAGWTQAGGGTCGDPLFLDQNEAQTAENLFLETEPLPHLRVWMNTPPPQIRKSESATVWLGPAFT